MKNKGIKMKLLNIIMLATLMSLTSFGQSWKIPVIFSNSGSTPPVQVDSLEFTGSFAFGTIDSVLTSQPANYHNLDFEEGNTSDLTSVTQTNGTVTVSNLAEKNGTYGLKILYNGTGTALYANKTISTAQPLNTDRYVSGWIYVPSTLDSVGASKYTPVVTLYAGTPTNSSRFILRLDSNAGGIIETWYAFFNDSSGGTSVFPSPYSFTAGWNKIDILYRVAKPNGGAKVWINNILLFDNMNRNTTHAAQWTNLRLGSDGGSFTWHSTDYLYFDSWTVDSTSFVKWNETSTTGFDTLTIYAVNNSSQVIALTSATGIVDADSFYHPFRLLTHFPLNVPANDSVAIKVQFNRGHPKGNYADTLTVSSSYGNEAIIVSGTIQ